ncbi:MAG: C2H2-type zinc finger protein [Candidatus Heimdallarchaeota archaeon]|nr:C2H2-type zinc finger protein [Candidatus Heimdallarchaeota archaeon]MCK4253034.1 C2H2-type zinc finger protein [Candidatus Heimdallarchaeota archaeon]
MMKIDEFKCDSCGKHFTRKDGLTRHIKTVHNKEKMHKCPKCGLAFSRKDMVNRHVRDVHLKIKNHVCKECGMKFAHKAHLERHFKSAHENVREFVCEHCWGTFVREDNLQRHINAVHLNLSPHICKECGAAFKLPDHLKQHIISIHGDQRQYVCTECGFAFKLRQHLNDHVKVVHQNHRPYACEECDSSFAHARALKQHIISVHTDELPYVCEKCKRGFADPSHLYRHEQAEACWFTTTTAYKWEELCKEIAEILLEGKNWEWKPTIETPELEEQTRVQPEIVIYNDDGTMDFIDAKRSTYAIYKEKDLVVYPKVARRVEFWCLYGKTEGLFKEEEGVEGKSSEEILTLLKEKIGENKRQSLAELIMKIQLLKKGIEYRNQSLLSPSK